MSSASNSRSYGIMRWALENARNGFFLYTASPKMQRRVADHFSAYGIAIYDCGKDGAPYSFAALAKWSERQDARIYFVINMQTSLREESDMINLNLSRDLLKEIDAVWFFGMTPDTDGRMIKTAVDFYSFIRLQMHFEDEGIDTIKMKPMAKFRESCRDHSYYKDAKEQLDRKADLCEELLALPMETEPERLLAAAMTLEGIAELHYDCGSYDYAMKLYMRVKEIREKMLGEEHTDTADTYNDIANVSYSQGNYTKAQEWYRKSYDILLRELGDKNPRTIAAKGNLSALLKEDKRITGQ